MGGIPDLAALYDSVFEEIQQVARAAQEAESARAISFLEQSSSILARVHQAEELVRQIVANHDLDTQRQAETPQLLKKIERIRSAAIALTGQVEALCRSFSNQAETIKYGRKFLASHTGVAKGSCLDSEV